MRLNLSVRADLGLRMRQEKVRLVQRSSWKLSEDGNGTADLLFFRNKFGKF